MPSLSPLFKVDAVHAADQQDTVGRAIAPGNRSSTDLLWEKYDRRVEKLRSRATAPLCLPGALGAPSKTAAEPAPSGSLGLQLVNALAEQLGGVQTPCEQLRASGP